MAQDQLDIAFGWWVDQRFSPEIRGYCDILLNRVDPIFADVDGEQRRAAEEFMNSAARHARAEDDYESLMEAAYEHGIEAAQQFLEMRAVFLATGVSGLFHLFEKQLYLHLNKELQRWLVKPIAQWRDLQELIPHFGRKWQDEPCMNFINAFQNPDLQELRLVANAIKHGNEGPSYQQLVKSNAIVVSRERIDGDYAAGPHTVLGVDISVQREDVERYRDSILRFWGLDGTFWAPRSAFK